MRKFCNNFFNRNILICVLANNVALAQVSSNEFQNAFIQTPTPPTQISAGGNMTCTIFDKKVYCWGKKYHGLELIPDFKNPTQIVSGKEHVCVWDDEGVKCWSKNPYAKEFQKAKLLNPTQISAKDDQVCARHNKGILCWKHDELNSLIYESNENIKQISAGSSHTCALHDSKIKCLGSYFESSHKNMSTKVPALNNPTFVASGHETACAIDNNKVVCWGSNEDKILNVPNLNNPKKITVGRFNACAINNEDITCWGGRDQTNSYLLNNPTQISLDTNHACAVHDNGVRCWPLNGSEDYYGEKKVSKIFQSSDPCASVKNIHTCASNGLRRSARYLYKNKSELLIKAAKIIENSPEEALALLFILKSFFENQNSQVFINDLNPNLQAFLSYFQERLEINSEKLLNRSSVLDSKMLHLTSELLKSLKDGIVSPNDREVLDNLMSETALSIHNPSLQNNIVKKLKLHMIDFERLAQNPNTRPIALSLLEILKVYFKE